MAIYSVGKASNEENRDDSNMQQKITDKDNFTFTNRIAILRTTL